jgi:hypothetical protein
MSLFRKILPSAIQSMITDKQLLYNLIALMSKRKNIVAKLFLLFLDIFYTTPVRCSQIHSAEALLCRIICDLSIILHEINPLPIKKFYLFKKNVCPDHNPIWTSCILIDLDLVEFLQGLIWNYY